MARTLQSVDAVSWWPGKPRGGLFGKEKGLRSGGGAEGTPASPPGEMTKDQ